MDKNYWDSFYASQHPDLASPSSFAESCLARIPADGLVFELGCGNGRDALYLAANGFRVAACDQSAEAISHVQDRAREMDLLSNSDFFVGNFGELGTKLANEVDVVYSRFTLHAVDEATASEALEWSQRALKPGGRLFIEARSVKGDLYGKGEAAGRDAYIFNEHYRRFIRFDELSDELMSLGFTIDESIESAGLAVHKDDDPVVIRLYCTKRA